jgi:hypothetical protein
MENTFQVPGKQPRTGVTMGNRVFAVKIAEMAVEKALGLKQRKTAVLARGTEKQDALYKAQ